jgi:heme/copper-type cytochrome/quinol oxidase subunit 3
MGNTNSTNSTQKKDNKKKKRQVLTGTFNRKSTISTNKLLYLQITGSNLLAAARACEEKDFMHSLQLNSNNNSKDENTNQTLSAYPIALALEPFLTSDKTVTVDNKYLSRLNLLRVKSQSITQNCLINEQIDLNNNSNINDVTEDTYEKPGNHNKLKKKITEHFKNQNNCKNHCQGRLTGSDFLMTLIQGIGLTRNNNNLKDFNDNKPTRNFSALYSNNKDQVCGFTCVDYRPKFNFSAIVIVTNVLGKVDESVYHIYLNSDIANKITDKSDYKILKQYCTYALNKTKNLGQCINGQLLLDVHSALSCNKALASHIYVQYIEPCFNSGNNQNNNITTQPNRTNDTTAIDNHNDNDKDENEAKQVTNNEELTSERSTQSNNNNLNNNNNNDNQNTEENSQIKNYVKTKQEDSQSSHDTDSSVLSSQPSKGIDRINIDGFQQGKNDSSQNNHNNTLHKTVITTDILPINEEFEDGCETSNDSLDPQGVPLEEPYNQLTHNVYSPQYTNPYDPSELSSYSDDSDDFLQNNNQNVEANHQSPSHLQTPYSNPYAMEKFTDSTPSNGVKTKSSFENNGNDDQEVLSNSRKAIPHFSNMDDSEQSFPLTDEDDDENKGEGDPTIRVSATNSGVEIRNNQVKPPLQTPSTASCSIIPENQHTPPSKIDFWLSVGLGSCFFGIYSWALTGQIPATQPKPSLEKLHTGMGIGLVALIIVLSAVILYRKIDGLKGKSRGREIAFFTGLTFILSVLTILFGFLFAHYFFSRTTSNAPKVGCLGAAVLIILITLCIAIDYTQQMWENIANKIRNYSLLSFLSLVLAPGLFIALIATAGINQNMTTAFSMAAFLLLIIGVCCANKAVSLTKENANKRRCYDILTMSFSIIGATLFISVLAGVQGVCAKSLGIAAPLMFIIAVSFIYKKTTLTVKSPKLQKKNQLAKSPRVNFAVLGFSLMLQLGNLVFLLEGLQMSEFDPGQIGSIALLSVAVIGTGIMLCIEIKTHRNAKQAPTEWGKPTNATTVTSINDTKRH